MTKFKYRYWIQALSVLGMLSLAAIPALADQGAAMMSDHNRQEMMGHYGRGGMPYGYGLMDGPGWGMMMGGYGPLGMMGGYGYGPLGMLQLSDEQRSKIEAIRHDQRTEQLKLTEKMMDEMDKIRDLMSADKRSPSTIGKAYEPVFILQRRMIENAVVTMNKVEAVLTKPQREEMKKFRHRGMGYGMMGY